MKEDPPESVIQEIVEIGKVGNTTIEKVYYVERPSPIDKLYTQIGNVNRLHNIIEPFAALF